MSTEHRFEIADVLDGGQHFLDGGIHQHHPPALMLVAGKERAMHNMGVYRPYRRWCERAPRQEAGCAIKQRCGELSGVELWYQSSLAASSARQKAVDLAAWTAA